MRVERAGLIAVLLAMLALAVASPLVAGATHVTGQESPSVRAESIATSASALGLRWAPRPPPGFDPVTAGPAERATYGFPPPPTGVSVAGWRAAMAAASTEAMPPLRLRKGAGQASTGWSGVVDPPDAQQGQRTFAAVAGGFNNPLLSISDDANRYSAIWVGLGGGSSGQASAAGTEEDQRGSGPQLDYAWWEAPGPAGGHAVVLDGFPAGPAESMYVWVASDNGRLDFFIENIAARTYAAFSVAGSCACDSAEWVDSATVPPLAFFNYVVFGAAYATIGGVTRPADGAVRSVAGETRVDAGLPLTIRRVG